jgi:hypothetical protein
MSRLRDWLFTLLSRTSRPPDSEPLPRPTPGEIMAVRVLIPVEGDRTPAETQLIVMFRVGYQKRVSEERPLSPFVPPPDPLKAPYYIAQIHTQHSLPAMPAISPLRHSRLTQILHAAVPVPGAPSPVLHKTRTLTPLPVQEEPIELFEEDDDDEWLNDATDKRRAV